LNYLINKTYGVFEQTEFFCNSEEDVIDSTGEDLFREIINNSFDNLEAYPQSVFDENVIESYIYSQVKDYILSKRDELVFISQQINETSEVVRSCSISLLDYILYMLDEDHEDCQSSCRVGGYIESCLMLFCERASWHISIVDDSGAITDIKDRLSSIIDLSNICLWFGTHEYGPQTPWMITIATTDLSFWFETDPWSFLEAISNMCESTLIWYTVECAFWVPDIDQIRRKCPVSFLETDTGESIIKELIKYNLKEV